MVCRLEGTMISDEVELKCSSCVTAVSVGPFTQPVHGGDVAPLLHVVVLY